MRRALTEHPVHLLSVACLMIHVAKREPDETNRLHNILTNLIGVRDRETTALLAVVAELLIDDPTSQSRCRDELAERDEHLPRWIAALPQIDVYRAVRRTHAFGDIDELVVGIRLDGRHEMTIAVMLDHNMWSSIVDAGVLSDPIDEVLAQMAEMSSDNDVFEISRVDARAWIEHALDEPSVAPESDAWPFYRPLVQWLVSQLPEGGEHRSHTGDWESDKELCDRFFATDSAAPFTDSSHRYVLLELFEAGSGDPLRWSPERVKRAIGCTTYVDNHIPLEVALDAPDLLRAFIPYAHAQSGIRDELTSRTLAMVDALRSSYKRELLKEANCWDLDDAG